MKWRPMVWMLVSLCLLTGCASLLERTYSKVEPHSSRFWESEAADTLRAENYQDIVNDLLILIGQHTESASLRLYNFEDDLAAAAAMEQAAAETQQETPLGAYAVEYMTSAGQSRRGYYEATVKISYRRTAEQVQSLVNATSPEAVYSLLDAALDEGRTELAIRVSYWGTDGRERVEAAVEQLRKERGLEETPPWQVNYYPDSGQVGLVEFLMDSETTAAMAAPPPKDQAGEIHQPHAPRQDTLSNS